MADPGAQSGSSFLAPVVTIHPVHGPRSLLQITGRILLTFLETVGANTVLAWRSARVWWTDAPRWPVVIQQLSQVGLASLPIVMVTGLSIGLVMAVQSWATLVRFNAEVMSGPMVMYSLATQLAPILTALLVCGRAGSNIAAELGTMTVTEQVDALRVMGTDPVSYLVAPRVLALTVLMPILGAVATTIGVFAGGVLLTQILDVDAGAYWYQTEKYVAKWDVLMGLAKCPVLGLAVGVIACREGLRTRGGASGVGDSCTRAVVQGCMVVLVLNFLLTVVINQTYQLIYK